MAATVPDLNFTTNLDKVKADKNPATSETARKKLGDDLDQFLLLLLTQLKNQDPTEPLETNEFTQQLVQFSTVEQAIDTNKNLEKILALSQTTQLNNAVSYIGKAVEAEGNKGVLLGGVAEFAYELPPGVSEVKISLTDESGRVVYSGEGSKKAGKNLVLWDGFNSFTSKTEPNGIYTISVDAKDGAGDKVTAKTFTSGPVTSVDLKDGVMELIIGTLPISMDKVVSIRDAAPYVPPPTTEEETGEDETPAT